MDLTQKLDTDWKDLLPVMTAGPKASDLEKPKPDSYDIVMRELKFEARGKVWLRRTSTFTPSGFVLIFLKFVMNSDLIEINDG